MCRLPHGRRGLKLEVTLHALGTNDGRLPHGRRGLKFLSIYFLCLVLMSPSSRKAGIEIPGMQKYSCGIFRSPSSRKAGIEIPTSISFNASRTRRLPHGRRGLKLFSFTCPPSVAESPSSRKAGIEIKLIFEGKKTEIVAFLTEGGD